MSGIDWERAQKLFHLVRQLPIDEREPYLRESCGEDEALRNEVAQLLENDSPESPLETPLMELPQFLEMSGEVEPEPKSDNAPDSATAPDPNPPGEEFLETSRMVSPDAADAPPAPREELIQTARLESTDAGDGDHHLYDADSDTDDLDDLDDLSATRITPDTGRPSGDSGSGPLARIGQYDIERELGRGGMGLVYLATDPRLKRPIALKVLPDAFATDRSAHDDFEREAQTLANLNHPNIATIYSLEEDDSGPQPIRFFTMEFIPGGTLAHRLDGKPLPLKEALPIARQIARALQAAHERGVVHRDLKPANAMVTPDDDVKILDFGIAGAIEDATEGRVEVSGTPSYMSPEQYRGEPATAATDLWALGCVLYECLTGKLCFEGISVAEIRGYVFDEEPLWSALSPDVPESIRMLLKSCLEKDPGRRPSDAAAVRRTLESQIARWSLPETEEIPAERATPHNLPRSLSTFVGRERQMEELTALLAEKSLVTLTGIGGCGKTRLSLEVARASLEHYPDGAWFVPLAPITDPDRVLGTALRIFALQETQDSVATLIDHLRDKRALLILDNCEHLLSIASELVQLLLEQCRDLTILTSSREGLGVPGEHLYQVPSLRLPSRLQKLGFEALLEVEAVRFFIERARASRPDFELRPEDADGVQQICRQLDGIPLALELAAARAKVLSVPDIARRLDKRFQLLTGGSKTALPRQQTLRATIDWSYGHLEEDEAGLLRRLSIFSGGFNLAAVEAVCADDVIEDWMVLDLLTHLVEKSLVEVEGADEEGTPYYRLLETVRMYSREKLVEEGAADAVRRRHRNYYLELAERADLAGAGQAQWAQILERERNNLRVALRDSIEDPDNANDAMRFVLALGSFWLAAGHWNEGRGFLAETLQHSGSREHPERAAALGWASRISGLQGDLEEATRLAEEGLAIEEARSDPRGIARAQNDLGALARRRGDLAAARQHFEESRRLHAGAADQRGVAIALHNLALVAMQDEDYDDAERALSESRQLLEQIGDQQMISVSLTASGSVAYEREEWQRAKELYEQALEICGQTGNRRTERNLLNNLGLVANMQGDVEAARAYHLRSLELRRELNDRHGLFASLLQLVVMGLASERIEGVVGWAAEALELAEGLNDEERGSSALRVASWVLQQQGQLDAAARAIGATTGLDSDAATELSIDLGEEFDALTATLRAGLAERYDVLTEEGRGIGLRGVSRDTRRLLSELRGESKSGNTGRAV